MTATVRERERESSWVSVSPVWDMQRPNEGEREKERERTAGRLG